MKVQVTRSVSPVILCIRALKAAVSTMKGDARRPLASLRVASASSAGQTKRSTAYPCGTPSGSSIVSVETCAPTIVSRQKARGPVGFRGGQRLLLPLRELLVLHGLRQLRRPAAGALGVERRDLAHQHLHQTSRRWRCGG